MRCPNTALPSTAQTRCQIHQEVWPVARHRCLPFRLRFRSLRQRCNSQHEDEMCENRERRVHLEEQDAAKQQSVSQQHEQHVIWCQGLFQGTFFQEAQSAFPPVDWTPTSLTKVFYYALPAAAAAVFTNSKLATIITHSTTAANPNSNTEAAAVAAAEGLSNPVLQQALLHFTQEAVLCAALLTACYLALGSRVVSAKWSPYWLVQTLATCLVLFPLVDPVISDFWKPAVTAVLGPPPVNPLVATLQQGGSAGDWSSLGLHLFASGVFGPVWEEVFWRGFFLTALTKVLPLPASVALSSLNFATLHLSPHNFLPLLVLSACCDCLYLKSGGNLLAPMLLHGLWNSSQVLQIALFQKEFFV